MPWLLPIAMWLLAVASLITRGAAAAQRAHVARARRDGSTAARPSTRRASRDPAAAEAADDPRTAAARLGGQLTDWGYAAGWRVVRAMPEILARNAFDAGALYAARGGGPEQLRKNLARVHRRRRRPRCPTS